MDAGEARLGPVPSEQWLVDRIYRGLEVTDGFLGRLGIPYTMIGGTLLGAFRHGGLIPWDDDADLGIRQRDVPELLAWAKPYLRERGFDLGYAAYHLKIFPRDGHQEHPAYPFRAPAVDLFPMIERGPGKWGYAYPGANEVWPEHFQDLDFARLDRHAFGPLRLSGPAEEEARRFLAVAYGPEWASVAAFSGTAVDGSWEQRIAELTDFRPALPTSGAEAEAPFLRWLASGDLDPATGAPPGS